MLLYFLIKIINMQAAKRAIVKSINFLFVMCVKVDLRIIFPGVVIPGSGVSMRAVQTAADKEPTIIGKPSKTMFEYIKERYIIFNFILVY